MTTEEAETCLKLPLLRRYSESTAKLLKSTAALEKTFSGTHPLDKDRQAALEVKTETDRLKRENNITLSKERLEIKRDISRKQEELKETLCRSTVKLADYHGKHRIPAASDFTDP